MRGAKIQTFGNRKSRLSETEKQDFGKSKVKTFEKPDSRLSQIESSDFGKSKPNNTNINNTDRNDTDYNETRILSYPIAERTAKADQNNEDVIRWIEERNTYERMIKDNIEYDIMLQRYEKEWLDEIIEIMVDVVCSKEPYIRINKQNYPQAVVKSRFLKIDSSHIEYIYLALKENTSNVRNIRAFLITTIYRSLETTDNWYTAKVNYDMAHG